MDVIARQGFKQAIVNLVGILIGALSTIYLYAHVLEAYGLVRFLIDTGLLLTPFVLCGLNVVAIKFFNDFEESSHSQRQFYSFLITALLILFMMFGVASYILITKIGISLDTEYVRFLIFLIPITILLSLSGFTSNFISNYKRIAVTGLLTNFLLKVLIPILLLLYYVGWISLIFVPWGIVLVYLISVSALLFYQNHIRKIRIARLDLKLFKPFRREMITYAIFGMLGGVGTVLAYRIDSVMVTTLIDLKSNGAYNIGYFIASVIAVPTNSMNAIAAPLVAAAWSKDDLNEVERIYKSSSLNLIAVGVLISILLLSCIDFVFNIIPNVRELENAGLVVTLLLFSRLFDMVTGVNHQIIIYSKYYRFNLILVLALGLGNVGLNYIFIVWFDLGIVGAALATSISIFTYNLIKLVFIWIKFKMQPFVWKSLMVILLGAILYLFASLLPLTSSAYLNIVVRTLFIFSIYGVALYYMKISKQFNSFVLRILSIVFD